MKPSIAWAAVAASAVIIGLLSGGSAPAAVGRSATLVPAPSPRATLAELIQDVGGRGASTAPQRFGYLGKIDSHLQDVAASRLGAGSAASTAIAARRQGVTLSAQGDALADIYVDGDAARAAVALRALGMRVTAVSDRSPQRMVEGFVPPGAIAAAAQLRQTQAIVAPLARLSAGSILSEGDDAINGPEARALGPTGAGVSVGIISDSMTSAKGGIANSVGTGDLPPDTVALSDRPDGTGEGRAMAEILYDEAPGVGRIRFATADGGPAAKANAIDALVADGARVIADDTSYVTEPFFQDDVIAQAVDRAKAAGVAYFIAAGNDAQHGWGAAFSPVADPSPAHSPGTEDFDPGPGVDTTQTIGTFSADESVDLVLQWAEPWGAATSDFALDVYEVGDATHTPLTFDTNNLATGIPMEWAPIKFTGAGTIEVAIRRVSGAGAPPLKLVAFTNGAGNVAIEHPADGGAIDPDAASAKGALTVAASNFATPTVPEPYSSRGPVTRFFDARGNRLATPEVRQKPDLAGPDGVQTSVPGFSPFPGHERGRPGCRRNRCAHQLGQARDAGRRAVRDHDEPLERRRLPGARQSGRRVRRRLPAGGQRDGHGARQHGAGDHPESLAGRARHVERVVPPASERDLAGLGSRVSSRRPGGMRSRQPHDVCLADLPGYQRRRDDRGTAERQDRPDGADSAHIHRHQGQDLPARNTAVLAGDRVHLRRSDLGRRRLQRLGLPLALRRSRPHGDGDERRRADSDQQAGVHGGEAGRDLEARAHEARAGEAPLFGAEADRARRGSLHAAQSSSLWPWSRRHLAAELAPSPSARSPGGHPPAG